MKRVIDASKTKFQSQFYSKKFYEIIQDDYYYYYYYFNPSKYYYTISFYYGSSTFGKNKNIITNFKHIFTIYFL